MTRKIIGVIPVTGIEAGFDSEDREDRAYIRAAIFWQKTDSAKVYIKPVFGIDITEGEIDLEKPGRYIEWFGEDE